VRPGTLHRYAVSVVAVAATAALALSASPPASAAPASHAGAGAHAGTLALPPAPPVSGLHISGVIHVNVSGFAPKTKAGTVVGYVLCLAVADQSCVGDNDEPSCCTAGPDHPELASPRVDSSTDLVLSWIASGVTGSAAWALVVWAYKHAGNTYTYVLKYLYHFKRLHLAPDAGSCEGDFAHNRDAILASCSSPTGIYWQENSAGSGGAITLWNTKGRGDLIASCNCRDTKLFDSSAHDFHRWRWWQVVAS
jgi:hypothetical protein